MQIYHANAKTNAHIRRVIKDNKEISSRKLSVKYGVSVPTIEKWKHRENVNDKSNRPHKIYYSITGILEGLALSIRRSSWLGIDDILEVLQDLDNSVSRSSLYRLFKRNGVNTLPKKEKEKLLKFKDYEPGYLHIDVTYLPKIEGQKKYLFVAIDRATRLLYYKVYDKKSSYNAEQFFEECKSFFPFRINYVLTDNGLEFSNKLYKSKKGKSSERLSKFDEKCKANNVEHRLTRPNTPKTNGMVERVNGLIKRATILQNHYDKVEDMIKELDKFLVYYNTQRRYSGLVKELGVKTPLQALEKWYEINPNIFLVSPIDFLNNCLNFAKKV